MSKNKSSKVIALAAIAAVSVLAGVVFVQASPQDSVQPQEIAGISDLTPPELSKIPIMKTFAIGYEMAPSKEMHKVIADDFPWMSDMMQYGEVLITAEEGDEFLKFSDGVYDYEITTKDGVAYYNINIYQIDMVPNTPYVKAYWHYSKPESKEFVQVDVKDNPSLKDAVTFSSSWVPVEATNDARNVEQLLEGNTKYITVQNDDGIEQFYELRYVDASQERVS